MLSPVARNLERGFTLIEVSIVLVIIGLVVGSVVAGKHLIHQSELQRTLTDVDQINTAANTFRMKYDYFPGDIPNATTFFSNAAGNGDGNSSISTWTEVWYAWNHLTLAKLYPGKFDGSTDHGRAGVNTPRGSLPATVYAYWIGSVCIYSDYQDFPNGGLFVRDAQYLDLKYDDGFPNTGNITTANYWVFTNSTTCVNAATNAYITSWSVNGCLLCKAIR